MRRSSENAISEKTLAEPDSERSEGPERARPLFHAYSAGLFSAGVIGGYPIHCCEPILVATSRVMQ
jgi:hypothetical protein